MAGNGQPGLYIYPFARPFVACGLLNSSSKKVNVSDVFNQWAAVYNIAVMICYTLGHDLRMVTS